MIARVALYNATHNLCSNGDIAWALEMNGVNQADHDAIMSLNFGLKEEVLAH